MPTPSRLPSANSPLQSALRLAGMRACRLLFRIEARVAGGSSGFWAASVSATGPVVRLYSGTSLLGEWSLAAPFLPVDYSIRGNLVRVALPISSGSIGSIELIRSPFDTAPSSLVDYDGDTIPDAFDNCTCTANAQQLDSNRDGIGNACDPDFDESGSVDSADATFMQACIGFALYANEVSPYHNPSRDESCAVGDLDEDGLVTAGDQAMLTARLGAEAGPSAFAERAGGNSCP